LWGPEEYRAGRPQLPGPEARIFWRIANVFVLNLSHSYLWPVKVKLPADGGRLEESDFDVEFKRIPQSRVLELLDKVGERENTVLDVTREIVLGWKRVHDSDKKEIPFSSDALEKLLEVTGVAAAIANAFFDSARGIKAKN